MQKIFLSIFLLVSMLSTFPALAQSTATEKIVYALFAKPEKIEWIKHFHGRIDDMNEVAVSLAYNGKKCKGLLTYLRSKEAIQLEGVLKNNLLELKEINREGAVSGSIKGEMKGEEIFAEWNNLSADLAGILHLRQVEEEIKTPSYCGDNMWIRCFSGQLPDDEMRLIVQKVEEGQLRGIAFLRNDKQSYRVIGEINEADKFKLILQSSDYQPIAEVNGTFQEISKQRALFKKKNAKEQYLLLNQESKLYMGCIEYADYLSSYDITYPKTINASFNNWMENAINGWVKSCRDYTTSVREIHPKPKPPLRSSVRAYGWSDIDFYSQRIISGFMTFNNTWAQEPEGHSFNFDLEQGREITLDDIFRKDFEYSIFVLEYLHKNQLKFQWYQDPDYRRWLAGRDFPHFTIREEGICFGTAFNPLYGRHELTIPYSDLKPYLKRRSVVEDLMK